MATLANIGPSEDPLSRVLNYHPDETPEQRSARQHTEHIARQISNEIDDYLKKEATKSKNILKLLLLGTSLWRPLIVLSADNHRCLYEGQAESGSSFIPPLLLCKLTLFR